MHIITYKVHQNALFWYMTSINK